RWRTKTLSSARRRKKSRAAAKRCARPSRKFSGSTGTWKDYHDASPDSRDARLFEISRRLLLVPDGQHQSALRSEHFYRGAGPRERESQGLALRRVLDAAARDEHALAAQPDRFRR